MRNVDRLVINLNRWTRVKLYRGTRVKRYRWEGEADYGYTAHTSDDLNSLISYCSDRMNPGRAIALLRLMDEVAVAQLRALVSEKP